MRIEEAVAEKPPIRPAYAWYVVVLLLGVSILGYVDRLVISLMIDPIKTELVLTDTQIGVVTALAFAALYVIGGVPLGWMIDKANRVRVLAACILVWSLSTSASGVARNFWMLFLARMGVGAGEAGLQPAAISMIGDFFPAEKVQRPISLFTSGLYIGGGMALIMGGQLIAFLGSLGPIHVPWVGEVSPWRATFMILGVPGLLFVLALLLTVKDPPRRIAVASHGTDTAGAVAFAKRNPRLLILLLTSVVLWGFNSYGLLTWYPTMLMRSFGMTPQEVAWSYGPAYLIGGTGGAFALSPAIGFLARRGRSDAVFLVCTFSMTLMAVASLVGPLMPSKPLVIALTGCNMVGSAMTVGAIFAIISVVVPGHLRGTYTGLYTSVMNIMGGALGAIFVGMLTDHVVGPTAVNHALAIMAVLFAPIAALLMYLASIQFRRRPPA